jgi:predicted Zn-dependent protease
MRILAALIASSLALSVAVPPTAEACLNPVRLAGNKAVKKVRDLENKLKAGKNAELVRYGKDYHRMFDLADPALQARALLVLTIAAMRVGEKEAPRVYWEMRGDGMFEGTPLERLRKIAAEGPENPLVLARIAEGLLRDGSKPENVAEATKIIEDLAARDLIPDAEGWLTLAQVRARAKDNTGRDAALVQCKKMARARKAMCVIAAGA